MTQMRRIITGVDSDGRSCVVEETHFDSKAPYERQLLLEVGAGEWPTRPDGHGELKDLEVTPGGIRWQVSRWEPDKAWPMHYTDSIDLELVIEGSVVLELDNGDHRLEAGDCVVMNGVDHGWRVGPDGCTVLIAILGTPSPRA